MIITQKEAQGSAATRELLQSMIDPVGMKIGVKRFVLILDGEVLIETKCKEAIETLTHEINSDDMVIARQPAGRDPKIVLYGVKDTYSKEDLVAVLK